MSQLEHARRACMQGREKEPGPAERIYMKATFGDVLILQRHITSSSEERTRERAPGKSEALCPNLAMAVWTRVFEGTTRRKTT
jgi:hypothetical protein